MSSGIDRFSRRISRQLIPLIVFILLMSACAPLVQKGSRPSDDWSRSLELGGEALGAPDLVVDPLDGGAYVVWPAESAGGASVRFAHVDGRGRLAAANRFDFPHQVKYPRLALNGAGGLHLFYAIRDAGQSDWSLWGQPLDPDGSPVGEARRISSPGTTVGKYVLVGGRDGDVVLAWDQGKQAEIYLARVAAGGDLVDGPLAVAANADTPCLQSDEQGLLHLAYLRDRVIYYKSFSAETPETGKEAVAVDLNVSSALGATGDTLSGPSLGVAGGWVYLFWSVLSNSDTEAGSAIAEYAAFPQDQPGDDHSERVWMIAARERPYDAYSGAHHLSRISPPPVPLAASQEFGVEVQVQSELHGDWFGTTGDLSDFIMSPAAQHAYGSELAVAFTFTQQFRLDGSQEIAVALFDRGEFIGYNVASDTRGLSDWPVAAGDAEGDLYLAWREGAGGRNIYFATTHSEAGTQLNRVVLSDLINVGMQALVEALISIAFVPVIGFLWMLPGFLGIVAWKYFKGSESVTQPSSWLPLLLALGLYYLMMLVSFPTLLSYVPFSAWIFIPEGLRLPLRLLVPAGILALALLAADRVRRKRSDSTFVFYVIVVLVDALFTLAIYGVNFLGAF